MREASIDRQVNLALDVLNTLSAKSMNANELVKHTSKDRSFSYFVIKKLRKEGLIVSIKSPEYEQRKIQSLSILGKDIARISVGVTKFIDCHIALRKTRLSKLAERPTDLKYKNEKLGRLKLRSPYVDYTDNTIRDTGLLAS